MCIDIYVYIKIMLITLLKENCVNNNNILNSLYNDNERQLGRSEYIRESKWNLAFESLNCINLYIFSQNVKNRVRECVLRVLRIVLTRGKVIFIIVIVYTSVSQPVVVETFGSAWQYFSCRHLGGATGI